MPPLPQSLIEMAFSGYLNWEQKEAPLTQREMVSDLLHHKGTQRSVGPDGIPPRVLRELAGTLCSQALAIVFEQSWIIRELQLTGS